MFNDSEYIGNGDCEIKYETDEEFGQLHVDKTILTVNGNLSIASNGELSTVGTNTAKDLIVNVNVDDPEFSLVGQYSIEHSETPGIEKISINTVDKWEDYKDTN